MPSFFRLFTSVFQPLRSLNRKKRGKRQSNEWCMGKKKKKQQKGSVFVSLLQADNNHSCVCFCVCRRRGKQTGTSINVSTLTVFKANSIFQNMPCHLWQYVFVCVFFFFFTTAVLFWHALWFCDCGETLLGSNSNLDGSHKSGQCSPLWRRTSDDDITVTIWGKKATYYCITFIAPVSLEEAFLMFESISVVSACRDVIQQPVVWLAAISLFIQLHLTPSGGKNVVFKKFFINSVKLAPSMSQLDDKKAGAGEKSLIPSDNPSQLKNIFIRWIIIQLSAIFSPLSEMIKQCLFGPGLMGCFTLQRLLRQLMPCK